MPGGKPRSFDITRRALATRFLTGLAALGLGKTVQASEPASAADPVLHDAALRGLALADHRGDPIAAATARQALDRLTSSDPEAAFLCRLYRKLDVRPSAYYHPDEPDAEPEDLRALHQAIDTSNAVSFDYVALSGEASTRTVLPLALIHPPQGVKLLAYCRLRDDYRQFFVRSIRELKVTGTDFAVKRLALLEGLVDKEGA